jgi:hypothetical protein
MDIFCLPVPTMVGEAMGLPCVATEVGDTAILVPAQNEQALTRGLLEIIALLKEQGNGI